MLSTYHTRAVLVELLYLPNVQHGIKCITALQRPRFALDTAFTRFKNNSGTEASSTMHPARQQHYFCSFDDEPQACINSASRLLRTNMPFLGRAMKPKRR